MITNFCSICFGPHCGEPTRVLEEVPRQEGREEDPREAGREDGDKADKVLEEEGEDMVLEEAAADMVSAEDRSSPEIFHLSW